MQSPNIFYYSPKAKHSFGQIMETLYRAKKAVWSGSSDPFLLRDAMLVRYMLSLCVRPSISPSQASIVPKWLNIGSQKQSHTIAQGLLFFLYQKSLRKFNGVTPTETLNTGGLCSSRRFSTGISLYLENGAYS